MATAAALQTMTSKQLLALFKTLPAPTMAEMEGEFSATLLDQGNRLYNAIAQWSINNPKRIGRWLCKAFTQQSDNQGHGYNSFEKYGKTRRMYQMNTSIQASRYDSKLSYQLYYPAYVNDCGKLGMIDEVRKVADGLYLGLGSVGGKKLRSHPMPFSLEGPIGEFVGADKADKKAL